MIAIYVATGASLGAIPVGLAVIAGWHRLIDFHDRHTDHTSVGIWPRRDAITTTPHRDDRQPIAAITNVAYQLVDDPHFGELPIGPLEPAHIHDQLIGAGQ